LKVPIFKLSYSLFPQPIMAMFIEFLVQYIQVLTFNSMLVTHTFQNAGNGPLWWIWSHSLC